MRLRCHEQRSQSDYIALYDPPRTVCVVEEKYIDGLMEDCSISSTLAMELL